MLASVEVAKSGEELVVDLGSLRGIIMSALLLDGRR
jgi:hypothetical protein